MFCRSLFVLICVVCSSSIYGFWSPLCYQTLLPLIIKLQIGEIKICPTQNITFVLLYWWFILPFINFDLYFRHTCTSSSHTCFILNISKTQEIDLYFWHTCTSSSHTCYILNISKTQRVNWPLLLTYLYKIITHLLYSKYK